MAHAWWLAAFDRTWGPGCLVDEPLMSAARGPPLVQVERDCDSGVSCGLLGRMHNMHRGPPEQTCWAACTCHRRVGCWALHVSSCGVLSCRERLLITLLVTTA